MITTGHVLKLQLKQRLQYRETFLVSILLHPIMMVVHTLLFKGIYEYNQENTMAGYSLKQMIWYFGAIHFFYYLVWNGTDKSLTEKVLYGGMETQLIKPFSTMYWEFTQLISQKLLSFFLEFIPVFGIYMAICFPEFMSFTGFIQYLVLTAFAFVQFFLLSYMFGVLAFVWHNVSAFNALKFILVNVLAGASMPVAFFPGWLQKIIMALPFHYLFHTPVQYLLGKTEGSSWPVFFQDVLIHGAWLAALFMITQLIHKKTMRHYLSVGG